MTEGSVLVCPGDVETAEEAKDIDISTGLTDENLGQSWPLSWKQCKMALSLILCAELLWGVTSPYKYQLREYRHSQIVKI